MFGTVALGLTATKDYAEAFQPNSIAAKNTATTFGRVIGRMYDQAVGNELGESEDYGDLAESLIGFTPDKINIGQNIKIVNNAVLNNIDRSLSIEQAGETAVNVYNNLNIKSTNKDKIIIVQKEKPN